MQIVLMSCSKMYQFFPLLLELSGMARFSWVRLLRVGPGYQDSTCWTGWILSGKCFVLANQGNKSWERLGSDVDGLARATVGIMESG